jgi:hypothetical protein
MGQPHPAITDAGETRFFRRRERLFSRAISYTRVLVKIEPICRSRPMLQNPLRVATANLGRLFHAIGDEDHR